MKVTIREMEINPRDVKKLLIIKLKGVGDVILSTVVLENLHAAFPEASIDYLTEAASVPALEFITQIDQILLSGKKQRFSSFFTILDVIRNKYDLVIDFYANPRTAMITFLSGAKYRAGFPYRGRKYAYNFYGPSARNQFHAAQLHLELLKNCGLPSEKTSLQFGITNQDELFADRFLEEHHLNNLPFVVVSPTGGWASKKCPAEKLAELGHELVARYQVNLLIVWGPGDREDADEIVKLVRRNVFIAPRTSLREAAAMMRRAAFVISNDSGPMHIATAVGTPVLGLYGPTDPRLQGPYGEKHLYARLDELHCIGCNLLVCPTKQECFRNLSAERVLALAQLLIEKNGLNIEKRVENS